MNVGTHFCNPSFQGVHSGAVASAAKFCSSSSSYPIPNLSIRQSLALSYLCLPSLQSSLFEFQTATAGPGHHALFSTRLSPRRLRGCFYFLPAAISCAPFVL